MESVVLTTPETAASTTAYTITGLTLDLDRQVVTVQLRGETGKAKTAIYGPTTALTGATLLHSINTGNFTVNSLAKKIYQQLASDGILIGTITGAPL